MFVCKARDDVRVNYGVDDSGKPVVSHASDVSTSAANICGKYGNLCPGEDEMLAAHDNGQLLATSYPLTYPYKGRERFCTTTNGSRMAHSINECSHSRNITRNYPYTAICFRSNSKTLGGANVWTYKRELIPAYALGLDVLQHPSIDLRDAQTTAWHEMQPRFEGEVSMINSIFELKDFKDIAGALAKHPIDRLKKTFSALRRGRHGKPPGPGESMNSALNTIAGARLLNEFAIKPTISDIMSLSKALRIMIDDAQKQFGLDGENSNTRYSSRTFTHSSDIEWRGPLGYATGSGTRYTTKFTACLYYSYKYDNRSILDAAAQYLGLNWTAEAVWNSLPFSFLYDYINNLGHTLNIMRHDPNVHLNYTGYTESLLTAMESGLFVDPSQPFACGVPVVVDRNIVHSPTLVSGNRATFYTRSITAPNWGPVLPHFKKPNSRQFWNVMALMKTLL